MIFDGELSCIAEGEAAEPCVCHGLLGGHGGGCSLGV
jgi:hypothetical protein